MINKIKYRIEYYLDPNIPYSNEEIDEYATPEGKIIFIDVYTEKDMVIRNTGIKFRPDNEPHFISDDDPVYNILNEDELGDVSGFLYHLVPEIIWDNRNDVLKGYVDKTVGVYVPFVDTKNKYGLK